MINLYVLKKQQDGTIVEERIEFNPIDGPKPLIRDTEAINCLIARGLSVDLIAMTFSNLPIRHTEANAPCKWRGEMARFIWDNI